jgi:hypothetical protein
MALGYEEIYLTLFEIQQLCDLFSNAELYVQQGELVKLPRLSAAPDNDV